MRIATFIATLVMALCPMEMAGAPKTQTHTVTIEGVRFQPDHLTVARGDTVVWVNKDLVPHTATSESGGFDSGTIPAGGSWEYTVRQKGEFAYTCTYHPTMKATLNVK